MVDRKIYGIVAYSVLEVIVFGVLLVHVDVFEPPDPIELAKIFSCN